MTFFKGLTAVAASALVLALVVAAMEPAFAKDPVPYNAADAARKYCGRAYKRFCSKVPGQGIEAFNCLKQNVNHLPSKCRKAVQAL
jgi:hypothetical protein